MNREKFYKVFSPIIIASGIVSFIVPCVLTSSISKKDNSPISIKENFDVNTKINPGQNYLEFSVNAKHNEDKDLKYQWFTFSDSVRTNDHNLTPLTNLITGDKSTLKIVDDMKNSINQWMVCAVYDETNNFKFSKPTKLVLNSGDLQEITVSNLTVERLLQNIPIWSKSLWENDNFFDENNNVLINEGNSLLFDLITNFIGENESVERIKKD